ncbi:hypothetical protein [Paenibacillus sp. NEAU-GSW1]|uniref:hypothetical protein n=1 Tax=Paenibacillus sp. NEAU-GSW1 TaxID=2682486 RepID=UPI0012E1B861|nr:hypothetical protein [Paenibacillus sp. NEAU-GSW1]MUT67051.1 hypothetical protein [Paenibacillus sp. NEAU-GSW1]
MLIAYDFFTVFYRKNSGVGVGEEQRIRMDNFAYFRPITAMLYLTAMVVLGAIEHKPNKAENGLVWLIS